MFTSSSRSLLRKFLSSQWYSYISGGPTDFSVASSNSILDILANSPTFSCQVKPTTITRKHQRKSNEMRRVVTHHFDVLQTRCAIKQSNISRTQTYLRQKLAEVADLDTQSLDFFFHGLLVAVSIIQHPQRLIVLHMDLSVDHYITTSLVSGITKKSIWFYNQIHLVEKKKVTMGANFHKTYSTISMNPLLHPRLT